MGENAALILEALRQVNLCEHYKYWIKDVDESLIAVTNYIEVACTSCTSN